MSELKIISTNAVNQTNFTENQIKSPKDNKNKSSKTTTNYVLGGLAALGAISLAVIAIKSGKKDIVIETKTPLIDDTKKILDLTIDKFKEAGNKFVKGKAYKENGELYTGKIIVESKNKAQKGINYTLEYIDGLIQKSTKTDNGNFVTEKAYFYNDKNILNKVDLITKDGEYFNPRTILTKVYTDNGKLIVSGRGNETLYIRDINSKKLLTLRQKNPRSDSFEYNHFYYGKDGKIKYTVSGSEDNILNGSIITVHKGNGEEFQIHPGAKSAELLTKKGGSFKIKADYRDNINTLETAKVKSVGKNRTICIYDEQWNPIITLRRSTTKDIGETKRYLSSYLTIENHPDFGKIKTNKLVGNKNTYIHSKNYGGFEYNTETKEILNLPENITREKAEEMINYIDECKEIVLENYSKMKLPGDLIAARKNKTQFL